MYSRIHQGFKRTIKNTGKVVPTHAIKAQRGMEVTAPLILYIGPAYASAALLKGRNQFSFNNVRHKNTS